MSAPDANPDEITESTAEDAEPEKADENVEAPVPTKEKAQKETAIRSRTRSKGPESIPKAILKRKKPINYWLWAGPAAAVLVAVLLLLAYLYLL